MMTILHFSHIMAYTFWKLGRFVTMELNLNKFKWPSLRRKDLHQQSFTGLAPGVLAKLKSEPTTLR